MKVGNLVFLICGTTVANGLSSSTNDSIGALRNSQVHNLPLLPRGDTPLVSNCTEQEPEIVCPDPTPEPGEPSWSPWGPCTGECGYQTHSRTCIGSGGQAKKCKGNFLEKCVDVKQCCTYQSTQPPSKGPIAMVPFYSAPKTNKAGRCVDEAWKQLARGCGATMAILNPNNGPFASQKQKTDYAACMEYVSTHGVRFVGYVYSKTTDFDPVTGVFSQTGLRDFNLIKKDIDEWYRLFGNIKGFAGIFVDEASNSYQTKSRQWNVDHVAFYQKIVNYIRTRKADMLVVANVGGIPPAEMWERSVDFPNPVDVTVLLENPASAVYPKDGCLRNLWTKSQGTYGHGLLCSYVPNWDGMEPFLRAMHKRETTGATLIF
eukprot:Ihof_evm1s1329 gene=Ihof_evmTU1s1329